MIERPPGSMKQQSPAPNESKLTHYPWIGHLGLSSEGGMSCLGWLQKTTRRKDKRKPTILEVPGLYFTTAICSFLYSTCIASNRDLERQPTRREHLHVHQKAPQNKAYPNAKSGGCLWYSIPGLAPQGGTRLQGAIHS